LAGKKLTYTQTKEMLKMMFKRLLIALTLFCAPLAVIISTSSPASASTLTRQIVPLYEYAGSSTLSSDWSTLCGDGAWVVAAAATSTAAPNSSDSDWTDEEDDLAPAMTSCVDEGGEDFGYVTTDEGLVPLSTLYNEINAWEAFASTNDYDTYWLSGIFFDQSNPCTTGTIANGDFATVADCQSYYESLSQYININAADGGGEGIFNWGADGGGTSDPTTDWFETAGYTYNATEIIVYENSGLTNLEDWTPASWESSYSSHVAVLSYDVPTSSFSSACTTLDGEGLGPSPGYTGLGYYITDSNSPWSVLTDDLSTERSDC
jgi:Spherulation-specific family 4